MAEAIPTGDAQPAKITFPVEASHVMHDALPLGRGVLNITAIVLAAAVIQSVDQGNRTLLDPA